MAYVVLGGSWSLNCTGLARVMLPFRIILFPVDYSDPCRAVIPQGDGAALFRGIDGGACLWSGGSGVQRELAITDPELPGEAHAIEEQRLRATTLSYRWSALWKRRPLRSKSTSVHTGRNFLTRRSRPARNEEAVGIDAPHAVLAATVATGVHEEALRRSAGPDRYGPRARPGHIQQTLVKSLFGCSRVPLPGLEHLR